MRPILLALSILSLSSAPAGATLITLVADRAAQISAQSSVEFAEPETINVFDEDTLTGDGPFSGSVDATIAREGSTPLATADQTSDIGPGGVTATGSSSARGTGFSDEFTHASGFGTSSLYLTFDLLAPAVFSLDVTLAASGEDDASGQVVSRVELSGLSSGLLVSLTCDVPNFLTFDCTSHHFDGVLAADRYDLEVYTVTQALDLQSGGQASYDLAFSVPEPRLALLALLGLLGLALRSR